MKHAKAVFKPLRYKSNFQYPLTNHAGRTGVDSTDCGPLSASWNSIPPPVDHEPRPLNSASPPLTSSLMMLFRVSRLAARAASPAAITTSTIDMANHRQGSVLIIFMIQLIALNGRFLCRIKESVGGVDAGTSSSSRIDGGSYSSPPSSHGWPGDRSSSRNARGPRFSRTSTLHLIAGHPGRMGKATKTFAY